MYKYIFRRICVKIFLLAKYREESDFEYVNSFLKRSKQVIFESLILRWRCYWLGYSSIMVRYLEFFCLYFQTRTVEFFRRGSTVCIDQVCQGFLFGCRGRVVFKAFVEFEVVWLYWESNYLRRISYIRFIYDVEQYEVQGIVYEILFLKFLFNGNQILEVMFSLQEISGQRVSLIVRIVR